jgi:hypothetical protein
VTWLLKQAPPGLESLKIYVCVELHAIKIVAAKVISPNGVITAANIEKSICSPFLGTVRAVQHCRAQLPLLEHVHVVVCLWTALGTMWAPWRACGPTVMKVVSEHKVLVVRAVEECVIQKALRAGMEKAGLKLSVDVDLGRFNPDVGVC